MVILHCTTLHYVRRHITRNLSSPPFGVGHLYRLGWCDDLAATENSNGCGAQVHLTPNGSVDGRSKHLILASDRQDRLAVHKATYRKIMDYVDTWTFSCCKASGHFATGSGLVNGSALRIAVLM